jgi:hypothetical protein
VLISSLIARLLPAQKVNEKPNRAKS